MSCDWTKYKIQRAGGTNIYLEIKNGISFSRPTNEQQFCIQEYNSVNINQFTVIQSLLQFIWNLHISAWELGENINLFASLPFI